MNHERFAFLKNIGFLPCMIVDGGAYKGEWAKVALKTFPNTRVLCVEANQYCSSFLSSAGLEHEIAVMGKEDDKTIAYYANNDNNNGTGNSIFLENTANFNENNMHVRTLQTKCLDTILSSRNIHKVDMIKLDVQGSEIEVLQGASQTLAKGVEFILLEVSVLQYNEGAPLFADVVAYMSSIGYVLFDIWDEQRYHGHLNQLDMLFVCKDSKYIYKLSRTS